MIEKKDKNISSYLEIMTVRGETFDHLALDMYGDEKRAYDIIEFNPDYADVLTFDSGITLRLPVIDNPTQADTLPPWFDEDEDYTIYENE